MAIRVKISDDLKKSLHKDRAINYEKEELKRLRSMQPLSDNQDYRTEKLIENQFYNILRSKIANELGISKNKIKEFVHDIKIDKFAKTSSYNPINKIITIKIPTDSEGKYKIDDKFLGEISNSIGAEMGHALKFEEFFPKNPRNFRKIGDYYHEYYDRIGQHAAKKVSKDKIKTIDKYLNIDNIDMLNKLPKRLDEVQEKIFFCSDEKNLEKLKKDLENYKYIVDNLVSNKKFLSENNLGHMKYYAIADLMVKKFGIKDAYSKSPEELEQIIKNNQQIKKESKGYLDNISKMPQDSEEFKNELKTKVKSAYNVYNMQKSHFESKNTKNILKNDSAFMPVPGGSFIQKIMSKKAALKEKKLKKAGNLNRIEARTPQSITGANMGKWSDKILRKKENINNIEKQVDNMEAAPSMKSRADYVHEEIDNLGQRKKSKDYIDYVRGQVDKLGGEKKPPESKTENKNALAVHIPQQCPECGKTNVLRYIKRPSTGEIMLYCDSCKSNFPTSILGNQGEERPETIKKGGTARDAKCPKCGERNARVTDEGVYICQKCGYSSRNADDFFPKIKEGESGLSDIIHSSYMPVAVAAFVGLMIPILFGASMGTILVCVGIIFLGLSKI